MPEGASNDELVDLQSLLVEVNGDVELAATRISDGRCCVTLFLVDLNVLLVSQVTQSSGEQSPGKRTRSQCRRLATQRKTPFLAEGTFAVLVAVVAVLVVVRVVVAVVAQALLAVALQEVAPMDMLLETVLGHHLLRPQTHGVMVRHPLLRPRTVRRPLQPSQTRRRRPASQPHGRPLLMRPVSLPLSLRLDLLGLV